VLAEAFALDAREAQRLVDDLLADGGTRRFRGHPAGPDDVAALLSLQVAADVFLDTFGDTPDLLRAEYGPLFPVMRHVLVLDSVTRTAVGSLILQEAAAQELKTVVDAADPPWSMPVDRTLGALGLERGSRTPADLLLLAVRPGYRRHGLAQLLMYGGWMTSLTRGIDLWTAILDDTLVGGMSLMTEGAAADRRRALRALPRVAGQHARQRPDEPGRGRRPPAPGPRHRA
jgi:GNAT superfamily N-acetyltransferase